MQGDSLSMEKQRRGRRGLQARIAGMRGWDGRGQGVPASRHPGTELSSPAGLLFSTARTMYSPRAVTTSKPLPWALVTEGLAHTGQIAHICEWRAKDQTSPSQGLGAQDLTRWGSSRRGGMGGEEEGLRVGRGEGGGAGFVPATTKYLEARGHLYTSISLHPLPSTSLLNNIRILIARSVNTYVITMYKAQSKCTTSVSSLKTQKFHYTHFTDLKTEAQKGLISSAGHLRDTAWRIELQSKGRPGSEWASLKSCCTT